MHLKANKKGEICMENWVKWNDSSYQTRQKIMSFVLDQLANYEYCDDANSILLKKERKRYYSLTSYNNVRPVMFKDFTGIKARKEYINDIEIVTGLENEHGHSVIKCCYLLLAQAHHCFDEKYLSDEQLDTLIMFLKRNKIPESHLHTALSSYIKGRATPLKDAFID